MNTIYKVLYNNKKILIFPIIIWSVFTMISLYDIYRIKGDFVTSYVNNVNLKWSEIFLHNVYSAVFMVLLGILTLGIGSILLLFYNAYLTSASIYYVYLNSNSVIYSIVLIFTHGIMEIFAISLSFLLSTMTLRKFINGKNNVKIFYTNSISEKVKIFIIMLVLLFFASIVEAEVSNLVAGQFKK